MNNENSHVKSVYYLRQAEFRQRAMVESARVFLLVVFIVFSFIMLAIFEVLKTSEYNNHVCATWGYQEDCKTPLKNIERKNL